ncbi:MAG: hypothetical protein LDLANPLL_00960 [Turneriella sp.]|nr:hypothetical protein [Turneriella sp.]
MRVCYAVTFFATAFFTVAVVADACKDAEVRTAAEAALAELKILKYRGVDALFVVSGYNSLEAVLFQLGRHSKTENIERLTQLKDTFRRLQNN